MSDAREVRQAHLTVVPAAGAGTRLGEAVPKAWVDLGGVPMICVTLRRLHESGGCPLVVVVSNPPSPEWRDAATYREHGCPNVAKVVPGGVTRNESVRHGLHSVPLDPDALVLIHDAARPLVSTDDVQAVLAAAAEHGAAIGGWRITDTVKRVDAAGRVVGSVEREGLFAVATPQAFRFHVLENAIRRAGAAADLATDEASLVEAAGHPVQTVPVSRLDFKVTHPSDLDDARRFLAAAGARS